MVRSASLAAMSAPETGGTDFHRLTESRTRPASFSLLFRDLKLMCTPCKHDIMSTITTYE